MNIAGHRIGVAALTLLSTAWLIAGCAQPTAAAASSGETATTPAVPPFATDDTAYLTRLGLIRGHLRVGMELYRQGRHEHAKRHMKHPGDELYAALGDAFLYRGSDGFAAPLAALATLVTDDAADADVERAYSALLKGIAAAEAQVDPSMARQSRQQIDIVVNLLETAADEYGEGVVNGRIRSVHEYQDAYGFTRIALERATNARAAVGNEADRSRLNALVSDIQGLSVLWPELVPDDSIDGSAASIEAAARR